MNSNKLISGYQREILYYRRILGMSEKIRTLFREKRPIGEIITILEDKKNLMTEIEKIEESIAIDKEIYGTQDEKPQNIANIIDKLSKLIEEIIDVERENEILFNSMNRSGCSAGDMAVESPAYAIGRYSNRGVRR